MNSFLKKLITDHPRLGAALYAYKHSADPDYITKAMQTDPEVFRFRCLGDKNPDRNIYYIVMGDRGDGFFAEYGRLLMYLYVADYYHMTPVVRFTEDYLYTEKEPVNGHTNPFRYFYEEPAGIEPSDAEQSRNVVRSEFVHTLNENIMRERDGIYGYSDRYIEIMGRIDHKYIRLNKAVQSYIDENLSKLYDGDWNRVIGVHFRGTDYKRGLDGHPVYAGPAEEMEKAENLLKKGTYDKVFLATDDKEALASFKERFGEKLLCYSDVYRAEGDTSVAFSNDDRPLHHYNLGLEVLRDMETLAHCSALIAGQSQVSLAARITRSGRGDKYRDLILLDHGIVKNGKNPQHYYNNARK
ncbi:hypothetical protein SAMN06296386_103261 [Lachnospiraceae bacterium]|nr:hypothetical protein SAMN06296386_103261 [Lachnospiraceae bacterium]